MMVVKGFAAHEVGEIYTRARELCGTVDQAPQMFAVLYGLWTNQMYKRQLGGALKLATELLAIAREQSDTALLLQAHHAHWSTFFYLGNLKSCIEHARKGIELYDVAKHSQHAFIYGGHDPGVCCRGTAAECLWYLGYLDQALQNAKDAVRLARQLGHPFSELQALLSQAPLHFERCDIEATRRDAEAVIRLCADHDIAPHYAAEGRAFRGWAIARAGDINAGIGQISQGIETYRTSGAARRMLHLLALLGDACLHAGRSDEGLAAVAEGLANAEESGELIGVPELLCLKGQLLLSGPARDAGEAQLCFERALEVARGLDAKMLELRAATWLARFRAEQGERQSPHDLLAAIYGWFTEGFDTPDLTDAKLILETLKQRGSG
jgi:predicted ATPase